MDIGIAGGRNKAGGVLCFGEVEALVNAGHHDVEFGKKIIGQIELSVAQDVDFNPGEEPEVMAFFGELLVEIVDGLDLLPKASFIQTVGLPGRFRMVSD